MMALLWIEISVWWKSSRKLSADHHDFIFATPRRQQRGGKVKQCLAVTLDDVTHTGR